MRADLIFKIQIVLYRYAPSNSGFHVCLQQRLDLTDDIRRYEALRLVGWGSGSHL
jgi:hypothetical protein